jgi:hypothetical protein
MTETERITNEVMNKYGFDEEGECHFPLANVLGEGPNVSTLPNEDGLNFFIGIRNGLIIEVLAGLVIWGLWELHHPIMFLTHWLVSHAH